MISSLWPQHTGRCWGSDWCRTKQEACNFSQCSPVRDAMCTYMYQWIDGWICVHVCIHDACHQCSVDKHTYSCARISFPLPALTLPAASFWSSMPCAPSCSAGMYQTTWRACLFIPQITRPSGPDWKLWLRSGELMPLTGRLPTWWTRMGPTVATLAPII